MHDRYVNFSFMKQRPKVALLVNMVAPNRVRLYQELAKCFDLVLLHGKMEPNRRSWKEYAVSGARVRRVKGWQIGLPKRDHGQRIDTWFLHLEPHYIFELIKERPDAVITSEMGFRTIMGLVYGMLFSKPVWVWWGGTLHTERNVGKLRRLTRRLVAAWARLWISYGQTSTEYLKTLGIPTSRILQIQNNVDEAWFRNPAEPALDLHPKPVLLHVGQMIARKGITQFLRAAAQLQQEGRSFSIVFVGGGPDSDQIKQLVTDLHLNNVHFHSSQPPDKLSSFYRAADVLVFPTLEDIWGLVANEAMLSNVPVLCSKYAGCAPELCEPEGIFDPRDESDFVSALRRAVDGLVPLSDASRILTTPVVARMIARTVTSVLMTKRAQPENSKAVKCKGLEGLASPQSSDDQQRVVQQSKPNLYITTSWDDGHPLDLRVADLLDKYGLRGTFYVPIQSDFPRLNATELHELAQRHEIGAHTMTHCDLLRVSDDLARREIIECKDPLEQDIGTNVSGFCFPYGHFRRKHIQYLKDGGYTSARTVELMSINAPRMVSGVAIIGTTMQALNARFGHYERNALKRLRMGNLLRSLRFRNSNCVKAAEALITNMCNTGGVFHLWGHSWELEQHDAWNLLEQLLALLAQFKSTGIVVENRQLNTPAHAITPTAPDCQTTETVGAQLK